MSDQTPPAAPMAVPELDEVLGSLLYAVNAMARKATGAGDVREVREYGAAALNFAQSWAMLHPDVVAPQGVTPDRIAASVPKPPPAASGGAKKP